MRRTAITCLLLVSATAAAALWTRPAWPVDETRYLGVAWGMWARGDFLVPRLDGALYADKPPLLFWLMHAGWAVFGVNAWWPRLISPLAALLALWLTARLARRLFPATAAAELAPLLLCGTLLFAAWSTFLMFDMLLVCATLLALLGLLAARQDGGARGWLLCGAGLGAGFLIKGPVLLVHVLPVALAARWWSPPAGAATRGGAWGARLALALLLGVALALLWVIPAGLSGGSEYRDALLYGQAAHRLANTGEVPHAQPWWFYLAMLPLVLLPWSLWPRLWSAARAGFARGGSARPPVDGVRFTIAWALPALLLLSAIGSKQEQYLLPEMPALALLGAALLARDAPAARGDASAAGGRLTARRGIALLPGLAVIAAGAAMVCAARQWPPLDDPNLAGTSVPAGLALAAFGLALACARPRDDRAAAGLLACACAAAMIAVHLGAPPGPLALRDLRPASARLAALQLRGCPLAYLGKYRAQYDFFGRLRAPIASLTAGELSAWFAAHADGVLVTMHATLDSEHPDLGVRAVDSLPSGEWLWERSPGGAPVRSPGSR